MQFTIRQAKPCDSANLAALSIQVWLHTYATSGIRNALSEYVLSEYTKEHFIKIIEDVDQVIFVAESDGHLLGYAKLHLSSLSPNQEKPAAELCTLYIQEHFHRCGIGGALVDFCQKYLMNAVGSSALWLSVYHKNTNAIDFYTKNGFSQSSSFNFEFGGESHLNYVFVKYSA